MIQSGRTLLSISILGLASLGMACSSGGGLMPQRADQSEAVNELKRRVLELQRQSAVNEEEILRLRERLDELETQKRAAERLPPVAVGPPPEPVETFRPVVVEESDLEVPPRAVQQPSNPSFQEPRPTDARPGVETSPEGSQGGGSATVGVAAQTLYDRGYTLYHQGQYQEAEAAFASFLRGHSDSDLADNAQYWVGESRYARKDYQGALGAFRETVERFPQGNKVPDAMLKAGQCFEALGDSDAARETYQEIARRYPESAASVRADERIRRLQ